MEDEVGSMCNLTTHQCGLDKMLNASDGDSDIVFDDNSISCSCHAEVVYEDNNVLISEEDDCPLYNVLAA